MKQDDRYCTLPIGPQHPSLVEPEYLKVHLDGETIKDVDINLGFMHRGIEQALQTRTYDKVLFLIERICGICSSAHTVAYCNGIERLLDIEIPDRARYIRSIIAELERLHSHLLWLGIAGYEIGMDTIFQFAWKDRESVLEILEMISGNRINYAINRIGGVRRDISKDILTHTGKAMQDLDKRFDRYIDIFSGDATIRKRMRGIGMLKESDARLYSAVGPTARGSSVSYDVRKDKPYCAYDRFRPKVFLSDGEDIESRAFVRLREMKESARLIRSLIRHMPDGDLYTNAPAQVPEGETLSSVEAPRGELFYYIISDGTDKPYRIKIKTPTISNLTPLRPMLIGQQLADLPIVVSSIDPCFACTDRVTLVDDKKGTKKDVDETYLRRLRKR